MPIIATIAILLSVSLLGWQRPGATVQLNAIRGDRAIRILSGSTIKPDAKIGIDFGVPVNLTSFAASYRLEPETPSALYEKHYGREVQITFRKDVGSVYSLAFHAPVLSRSGFTLGIPNALVVRVAAPVMPPMVPAARGTSYRYGILAHPFPFSLGHVYCRIYACRAGNAEIMPDSERQFRLLCEAHVGYVRIDYPYSQIMTKNGKAMLSSPNFTIEDAIAERLAQCGITELPIILQYAAGPIVSGGKGGSTPMAWVTSNDPGNVAHYPGYADFARIVAQHLVSRFPQIRRVELFNEPNLHGWGTFPVNGSYEQSDESGRQVARYMLAAYRAVKSVAPQMTVVGPAIADGGHSTDPRGFLENLYASGCRRGSCWDVLSVHNYDWESPDVEPWHSRTRFDVYKDLQQIAAAHGDRDTHVMLTEWGYSTDPDNPYAFDETTQAVYVAQGFNRMLRDPSVDGITYVNMYNPGHDFWAYTALVNRDFTPKPAFFVFKRYATERP